MKRLLLAIIMVMGVLVSAQADTLRQAYERIAAYPGAKSYGEKDTDKLLSEINSNLPMATYSSVVWPYEQGSEGVTKAYDSLEEILSMAEAEPMIVIEGDYNTFYVFAVNDGKESGMADVMVVWQLNYYGRVMAVYGTMTDNDLDRLGFGEVTMNHFQVSIRPMSQKYYDDLKALGAIQQKLWSDQATHRRGATVKALKKEIGERSDRLMHEVERLEK